MKRKLIRSFSVLLASVITLVLFFNFFYVVEIVDGNSMFPVFENNDKLLINKSIGFKGYNRSDIVMCRFADENGTFIKRIIGISGDEIECKDGRIYRNSEDITDSYYPDTYIKDDFGKVTVAENMYFVVGDNINISKDSRQNGCITRTQIIGRIETKL